MTLADQLTISRLFLAPLIVAAYLLLPVDYQICFWVVGLLCGLAEFTDFMDGRAARARGEVSDFGKLADPFCDVIYRISAFLMLLLPAGGVGWLVTVDGSAGSALDSVRQRVYVVDTVDGRAVLGAGLAPWLPVFIMVLREIVAGALRSMAATKGLVLAARKSGKLKAWVQGTLIISLMGFPALWFGRHPWQLDVAFWGTWFCALLSLYSIVEYIVINRAVLAQLLERRALSVTSGEEGLDDAEVGAGEAGEEPDAEAGEGERQ